MKIAQLTPGTANFHCGACLRDEWLVKAWRRQGHDAVMVPMYLPLITDEPMPGRTSNIFFGGINVYLQQKLGFFRRAPRWLDRVFDWPALLRWSAKFSDMTTARDLSEMTLSMLNGETGK